MTTLRGSPFGDDGDAGGRRRLAAAAVLAAAALSVQGCSSTTDLAGEPPRRSAATAVTPPAMTLPTPTRPEATTAGPTAAPTSPEPPAVRECRRLPRHDAIVGVTLRASRTVPCSKTHNAQTYHVGRLTPEMRKAARTGDVTALYALAGGRCRRILPHWLGGSAGDVALSQFRFVVAAPTRAAVAAGARWLRCDLVAHQTRHRLLSLSPNTSGVLGTRRATGYRSCARGDIAAANTVVCSLRHRWRAVHAVRVDPPKAGFPGRHAVSSRMRSTCESRVRAYLRTTGAFRFGWIRPTKVLWNHGAHYGVCYAHVSQ